MERCKAAAVAKQIKASLNPGRHQQQSAHNAAAPPPSTPGAAAGAAVGAGRSSSGAGAGPAKTPGYNVAYVGNIAFEARTEDISGLFEGCGVTKVCGWVFLAAGQLLAPCVVLCCGIRCLTPCPSP